VGRRGGSGGEPTYELKFNTVDVPMQPEYTAVEVLGKNLEALSAGRIKVRTFHSGQFGDHQDPDRRTPRRSK
jgi:TRAP-type C4-dicarboxylate transport system substrate-binding protein